MKIKIGQFEFATGPGIYVRVPWIGAAFYSAYMGFTVDTWATLKATGEVR